MLKRGTSLYLGALVGLLFGVLLTAYLFITGILDVTTSGYGTAAILAQALPRAAKDLVPWLLVWLFVTPAVQRIRFAQPWLALLTSAGLGTALVPRMLGVADVSATQFGALFLFGLILTLPVVRAKDPWLPSAFFIALHVVTASIMGMPFGNLGEGIFASRLVGDELITGGLLGPVFGFAGVLGQLWIAGAMLQHQRLVFGASRARVSSRRDGLRQLAIGLVLASAAVAMMFAVTVISGYSRIAAVSPSLSAISDSLATALPVALASAIVSCVVLTTLAFAVVRRGWIAAIIAAAITVVVHLQSPGTNAYTAAGAGALALAMTLAFANTRRLWMPVGLAYGWLLFEGPIFGFPTNGFPIGHPWFQQQIMEYTTLGGGIIGPEASVFAIVAKCMLIAAVIFVTRSETFKGA
jgi:hypothetical protein